MKRKFTDEEDKRMYNAIIDATSGSSWADVHPVALGLEDPEAMKVHHRPTGAVGPPDAHHAYFGLDEVDLIEGVGPGHFMTVEDNRHGIPARDPVHGRAGLRKVHAVENDARADGVGRRTDGEPFVRQDAGRIENQALTS
jgi:hypothetical protein